MGSSVPMVTTETIVGPGGDTSGRPVRQSANVYGGRTDFRAEKGIRRGNRAQVRIGDRGAAAQAAFRCGLAILDSRGNRHAREAKAHRETPARRFLQEFLRQTRTVADTLRGVARDPARSLDISTLERLPAGFVTEHLGQRHADMPWRIQTKEGGWVCLLILLEFQSTIDRRMALRMRDYAVRVWMDLDGDDLGPAAEYPFVLPIVAYNGDRRWDAPTDIRSLFGPVPDELLGYLPRYPYLLVDIQGLDPSRLPPDNVLTMIARFEQAGTPAELEAR